MGHREVFIDGVKAAGVTSMLGTLEKPYLRPWYAKQELLRCIDELATFSSAGGADLKKSLKAILATWRRRIKEKDYAAVATTRVSSDIGTDFHDCVECYLRRDAVNPKSELVGRMMREFALFDAEYKFKPLELEFNVVSKRYLYQGTFDFIGHCAKLEGLGVADWKTSNKIDDTFGLQLALYAYAYGEQAGWTPEETWDRIKWGICVRLDKKSGGLEHKVYTDLPYLFRVAIALREPYDYMQKIGIWEEQSDT